MGDLVPSSAPGSRAQGATCRATNPVRPEEKESLVSRSLRAYILSSRSPSRDDLSRAVVSPSQDGLTVVLPHFACGFSLLPLLLGHDPFQLAQASFASSFVNENDDISVLDLLENERVRIGGEVVLVEVDVGSGEEEVEGGGDGGGGVG